MCECNSIYKHGKVKCPKGSCPELRGCLSPTNRVFPVLGNAVVGQTQKRLVKVTRFVSKIKATLQFELTD